MPQNIILPLKAFKESILIWISVSKPLKPILGKKFHEDFESAQNKINSFNQKAECWENENSIIPKHIHADSFI